MSKPDLGLSGVWPKPVVLIGAAISRELRNRYEDGGIGSCDWGYCPHDAEAFAWSASDAADEYLPICGDCARGKFPQMNDEPYPVDRRLDGP